MTQDNRTIVRLMPEEVESLKSAAEQRFGESSRISLGAMVRLLAEEATGENR